MIRYNREYFAGRYVAQEARTTMRGGDHAYANGAAGDRFTSAAVINTDETPTQGAIFGLRSLRFELPMPPSVNEAWIDIAYRDKDDGRLKVRRALTDAHRAFRSLVGGIVRGTMLREESRAQPLLGRLELVAVLYYKDRRRTDIGNREKSLTDALTHAGAYKDDSQIDDSRLRRVVQPGCDERCEVTLTEVSA